MVRPRNSSERLRPGWVAHQKWALQYHSAGYKQNCWNLSEGGDERLTAPEGLLQLARALLHLLLRRAGNPQSNGLDQVFGGYR